MPAEVELRIDSSDSAESARLLEAYEAELVSLGVSLNHGWSGGVTPDQLRAPHGAWLVGWRGDEAVACGGVRLLSPEVAEVKRMYVDPSARGGGLARRLVARLEAEALALGCPGRPPGHRPRHGAGRRALPVLGLPRGGGLQRKSRRRLVVREGPARVSITLHFHPDWPHGDGWVIESMAADGVYRNQFVTGVSNGLLAPHPDSPRRRWEDRLFGDRYVAASPSERPVYGSWSRAADPYGGSPRFGSAHFRLRPSVTARATYCFPDSTFEPDAFGGPDRLEDLCRRADGAGLGEPLDDYVEAQVHGGVVLDRDVEALVLDPCHATGPVRAAAERLGCPGRAPSRLPGRHRLPAGRLPGARAAGAPEVPRRRGGPGPRRCRAPARRPRPAGRQAGVAPARALRAPGLTRRLSARSRR